MKSAYSAALPASLNSLSAARSADIFVLNGDVCGGIRHLTRVHQNSSMSINLSSSRKRTWFIKEIVC